MKLNKNLVLLTLFVVILFSLYVSFIRIRDKEIFSMEHIERIEHILHATVILIFFITIIIYLYNKNPIAHVY